MVGSSTVWFTSSRIVLVGVAASVMDGSWDPLPGIEIRDTAP
jgi:hypothetical protein